MKQRGGPTDRQEPTLKVKLGKDPLLGQLAAAARKLRPLEFVAFKRLLSGFRMVTSKEATDLNFPALSRNLRAVAHVNLGEQEADVLFTRNSAFLLFQTLPDFSQLAKLIPDMVFSKKRAVLAESETEKICLIRVTGQEFATMLAISTLASKGDEVESRGVPQESMPIGEKTLQDVDELNIRLRRWQLEFVTEGFDFERFINDIRVCREFDNGRDSRCYVVVLEDDRVYSISYDTPWERSQAEQQREFEPSKAAQPLCWLSDGGRLYMIRQEFFVPADD